MELKPEEQVAVAQLKTHYGYRVLVNALRYDCMLQEQTLAEATVPVEILRQHARWVDRRELFASMLTAPDIYTTSLVEQGYDPSVIGPN